MIQKRVLKGAVELNASAGPDTPVQIYIISSGASFKWIGASAASNAAPDRGLWEPVTAFAGFRNGLYGPIGVAQNRRQCKRASPLWEGSTMTSFIKRFKAFLSSEAGPTATEYAVMLALIIVVALASITALGTKVSTTFSNVTTALPTG